ncbi:hypothetical protein KC901_01770 [Patescibacteria group bacterium]|nr:hypothetical protein [Patescibacteria group bacterium]
MTGQRKICDSWYHQRWFRILLVIVGLDMMVLGVSFMLDFDVVRLIHAHTVLRVIGGLAYILVAIFIIHQALSYPRMKREVSLLCQHCGQECYKKKRD